MLTYHPIKRPKFVDVLDKFNSLQSGMMHRINQKYGYGNDQYADFDEGLRLTRSISPYLANAKKGHTMQEKIKQE